MVINAVSSWQVISTTQTWNQLRPGYDKELAWKTTAIVMSEKASVYKSDLISTNFNAI